MQMWYKSPYFYSIQNISDLIANPATVKHFTFAASLFHALTCLREFNFEIQVYIGHTVSQIFNSAKCTVDKTLARLNTSQN